MQKIIVSAEEQVCCPKCAHCFPLKDGIARQTLERYESEYDTEFKQREEERHRGSSV